MPLDPAIPEFWDFWMWDRVDASPDKDDPLAVYCRYESYE